MPYCNTISFADNIYDYWCNNVEINTAQEAFTTYDGQEDHEFRTIPVSELRTTETTADEETSNTSNNPGPTVSEVPTSSETTGSNNSEETGNSDNNNDNSNDDGGNDTPIGAIVGGVVGGVGAIGIAGLGIWFFLRRKKNKAVGNGGNQTSPGTAYAPVDQGGAPPQGQYDMSQQQQFNGTNSYYDPKFVAAGAVPYQNQQQYGQYPPQQQYGAVTPSHVPSSNSPPMSHMAAASNASPSPANTYNQPNYQQPGFVQPNAPVIHEAPSNPTETPRGAHELA